MRSTSFRSSPATRSPRSREVHSRADDHPPSAWPLSASDWVEEGVILGAVAALVVGYALLSGSSPGAAGFMVLVLWLVVRVAYELWAEHQANVAPPLPDHPEPRPSLALQRLGGGGPVARRDVRLRLPERQGRFGVLGLYLEDAGVHDGASHEATA